MKNLFSPDSIVMRYFTRGFDLMLLNLYFLFTSIPIITMGASLTALYTVVFRFDTIREDGVTRTYFRAFKSEFKQATLLWLPIAVFAVALCVNMYIFASLGGYFRFANIFFGILLALDLFVSAYAFPLLSQFNSKNKEIIINALAMSLGYLPRTIIMVLLNLLPVLTFLLHLGLFFVTALLWALFWFAIAAYLNSLMLKKVFKPFIPEDDELEEQS